MKPSRSQTEKTGIDLEVTVGSLRFKNPLLAASGTWSYGVEFLNHPVQHALAAFVTKSLSVEPSPGNPMPRLYETDGGLLNSIGLQNVGIDYFLRHYQPRLEAARATYVLSVYAKRLADFEQLAEKANGSSAVAVEFNISCPNVDKGGLEFSSDPKETERVCAAARRLLKKPLWVKLSPNVTDITEIARAAEGAGADALSMINTLLGMSINVEAQKPWLGRRVGGLSGPAIRPVAVERVFRTYQKVKIPIVGMGGIRRARDVLEFLMAGAAAVQIGTHNFKDSFAYSEIAKDLTSFLASRGVSRLQDLVGAAHES